jgi:hypothetical protein
MRRVCAGFIQASDVVLMMRRTRLGRFGRPSRVSIEQALSDLGSPKDVLLAHGVKVRGRTFFCPLHNNSKTPAGSLYERAGKQRWHCHSCELDGDALDLESALSGRTIKEMLS